jgi:hypothetical protein
MSDAVRREAVPRTRSFLIFSAVLVGLVSGVIACNDAPEGAIAPKPVSAAAQVAPANKNPLKEVGEGHNAMVDAVLRDVAKTRSRGGPQKRLCKQVEESAIAYARANAKNPGEAVAILKSQDFCGSSIAASGIKGAAVRANLGEGYDIPQRAVDLLSMTDYYVSISYSAGQLDSYLGPINAAAMAELGWEDAQIVTSATSVAVSSLGYWTANLSSWGGQFGTAEAYLKADRGFETIPLAPKNSFWGDVWDITKADLEGAVSGGVAAKLVKAAIPEYAMWTAGGKSLIRLINKL